MANGSHERNLAQSETLCAEGPPFRLSHALAETDCVAGHVGFRTDESVRELSDWNSVTTSPEVGASPGAETLRVRAALYGFAAPAKTRQAILTQSLRGGIFV